MKVRFQFAQFLSNCASSVVIIVSQDLPVSAVCNCLYGTVARVVYSRTFPSLTTPQTGRLNKSPHTVHAIANRHRKAAYLPLLVWEASGAEEYVNTISRLPCQQLNPNIYRRLNEQKRTLREPRQLHSQHPK